MEHSMQKETIYFLERLAHESGFTEDQILENMKPENQKWIDKLQYSSIKEFIRISFAEDYIREIFLWEKSFLKPDYHFWNKIRYKWYDLADSDNYYIEFSRYPIKNWRLKILPKKIKVKSKLKI